MTYYDQVNSKIANAQEAWLQSISGAKNQSEQVMLNAAKQAAANQALSREIQLGKSQLKLQQLVPALRSVNNQTNGSGQANGQFQLPLPSDLPWVGKYATNYQQYQNRMPQRLQGIDEMLPKAYELLTNRAETVETAKSAANQAKTAYLQGRTALANVLESARIWQESERSLIASVVSYNQAIADYALNLRQDINQPERVVAMLLGKKALNAAKRNSNLAPQPDGDRNVAANNELQSRQANQNIARQNDAFQNSAYQNAQNQNAANQLADIGTNQEQESSFGMNGQGTLESPFTAVSTIDGTANGIAGAESEFEYGPTPESASKANFDRSKLTTNSATPYREAQSTSASVSSIPKATTQFGSNQPVAQPGAQPGGQLAGQRRANPGQANQQSIPGSARGITNSNTGPTGQSVATGSNFQSRPANPQATAGSGGFKPNQFRGNGAGQGPAGNRAAGVGQPGIRQPGNRPPGNRPPGSGPAGVTARLGGETPASAAPSNPFSNLSPGGN